MRLLYIKIKNFKPFSELEVPTEGDLPEGLILVRGRNSTGKSSLFEAVLWAIWGANAVALSNEDLINSNHTFMRVVLEFEVAGTRYRIDRSYDRATRTKVVLSRHDGSKWVPIGDRVGTVERAIQDILRLDVDQALNTLLVRQGEVAKIALSRPAELRDLLVKVYNIDVIHDMGKHIEYLEDNLRARVKALEEDYVKPERLEQDLRSLEEEVATLERELEKNTAELESRRQSLQELPDGTLVDRLEALQEQMENTERDISRTLEERKHALKQAGLPVDSEEAVSARRKALESQIERTEKEIEKLSQESASINQEIGAIKGREADLRKKIETLQDASADDSGVTRCPTCSKPLAPDERDHIVSEYREMIEAGRKRLSKLTQRRKEIENDVRKLRHRRSSLDLALRAIDDVIRHDERIRVARQTLEELRRHLTSTFKKVGVPDLDALLSRYGVKDLPTLRNQARVLKTQIEALERRCEDLRRDIDRRKDRIEELRVEVETMRQRGAEIEELRRYAEHARYVRLNLAKGFVSDWVFQKRLIGIIRRVTVDYLASFTAQQYTSIDLVPASTGRTPGLVLEVYDQRDGLRKRKEKLSYGDRTAVSLALRMGIARTMSVLRPLRDSPSNAPRVRCVMLDEPLSGLDAERRQAVVLSLVNDSNFRQIFLITHTEVQNLEGVPVIEVEKSGDYSTATLVLPSEI